MRLSKIKLSGFKSFVDPTTISFPGNLMGVVGPNGCGKSNIIDAIRWVLGESSAKTLRGDSMADVIFNGSSGRKPVGQASIELIFDNSDGSAGGAYASYAEIAVRRVVSRDGTSQYYLNNARCRRKDITHIMLGTGLGSHGYSIIEQGMISRLVEAKPEELRSFLEEAAGISRYKDRRRETEHRIRHTKDNLERLADLRDEIDKQLSHLQRQARAAERYKDLRAQLRRKTAELLALRLRHLREEVAAKNEAMRQSRLKLDAAITEQRHVESQIEQLRVRQAECGESFNDVQGEYYRLGAEIARLEQVIQHRKETVQRQREDLATTEQQLSEIRGHIENDQVEIRQLELVLSELSPDLENAKAGQRAAEAELRDAETAMDYWREQWSRTSQALADIQRTQHVEEARLEQLAVQRERLEKQSLVYVEERDALAFQPIQGRLDTLVGNEEQLRGACAEANRGLDSLNGEINELRDSEKSLSERLDTVRAELQNSRGRLSSLEALQEAAFGKVSEQVTAWFDARGIAQSPRLAETLEVEPGWERAVEMVLGNFLQAVGVPSFEVLQEGLSNLCDSGFALISVASSDDYGDRDQQGRLLDYVKSPASARALIEDVLTANDLQTALAMRGGLARGESIVTRDGFWVGPHWLRISAGDDPRMGVIARGEEILQLRASVERFGHQAETLATELTEARGRLAQVEQARHATQREANRRQQMYAEVCTRLTTCRNMLKQMRERRVLLDDSITNIKMERDTLLATAQRSRAQLDASAAEMLRINGERDQLESQRGGLHERLATARAEADAGRELAQRIAIQVESRRSSKESASAALERVRSQQGHLLRRQSEIGQQIEATQSPIQGDESALAALLDEHAETDKRLAEARAAVEAVDAQLREAENSRNEQNRAVGVARESVDSVRLELREAEVRADTVSEQFAQTDFELETIMSELASDATVEAWAQDIDSVDLRIQRLGAINLAAIDEFKEQSERKEYLDRQYEDLIQALGTLESAIRKIDRETRAKFRDTFDRANQGLGELFPRLFGGGSAYLELDSEDLLTCGVTIMARPPGKRISTIHLLSGGEKALTAVALVFSIFELNPAPFCLLDEVDAPLDEANVGRFSDIVREMSQRVQFVIITHNKTTMESMGQLTGVTMNEPGVSRLVAVDIEEAVQLAAM